ncbi:class II lanthipeptide, LchA2/BrtA2 family [Streptomyces sp. NPDC020472]|uniref:class II lanthipeptide, LchA2/BrtA2 family n=1 Tax=Streptomyces sp. NPDC020472 TaxID=3365075 RepID=UPI003789948F
MEKVQADVLGGYDEFELVEMGEADVYGGTTWSCAIVTLVSAVACPTTKCTSQC